MDMGNFSPILEHSADSADKRRLTFFSAIFVGL